MTRYFCNAEYNGNNGKNFNFLHLNDLTHTHTYNDDIQFTRNIYNNSLLTNSRFDLIHLDLRIRRMLTMVITKTGKTLQYLVRYRSQLNLHGQAQIPGDYRRMPLHYQGGSVV